MTTQLAHPTTTTTTATAPLRPPPITSSGRRIAVVAASALIVGAAGLGAWSASTSGGSTPTAPALPDSTSTELAFEGIEMLVAQAVSRGIDPMTLFPSVDVVPDFDVP